MVSHQIQGNKHILSHFLFMDLAEYYRATGDMEALKNRKGII